MNLLFDIETDGLYDNLTTIHCVAIKDIGNNEVYVFNDQGTQDPIARAITMLEGVDYNHWSECNQLRHPCHSKVLSVVHATKNT